MVGAEQEDTKYRKEVEKVEKKNVELESEDRGKYFKECLPPRIRMTSYPGFLRT